MDGRREKMSEGERGMLGTFPKDFPQVATSQGYFPKWQLPKCAISQAATFQVCPSHSTWPSFCSSRGARCQFWLMSPEFTYNINSLDLILEQDPSLIFRISLRRYHLYILFAPCRVSNVLPLRFQTFLEVYCNQYSRKLQKYLACQVFRFNIIQCAENIV